MQSKRRFLTILGAELLLLLLIAVAIEGISIAAIAAGLVPGAELRMKGPMIVRPHPLIGFVLREGARRGTGTDAEQIVNNRGYRGAEPGPRGPGLLRVLCVGDSVMYGDSLPEGDTLPARIEELLRDKVGPRRVEVINAGVLQYTSAETLVALALRGIDLQPDIVIFYQGANDVAPRLVRPFRNDYYHYRNVWEADTEMRADLRLEASSGYVTLRWLAGIYPAAGRIDAYTTRPLTPTTQNEKEFAFNRSGNEAFLRNEAAGVALARSCGARSLIVATPYNASLADSHSFLGRMMSENKRKQLDAAAKQGANFVAMPDGFGKDASNFRDSVHLTAAGAKAVAKQIVDEMDKLGWLVK